MKVVAKQLNDILKERSNTFYTLLSDFGKRVFMPKGIPYQAAEAKKSAIRYNATIGIASDNNKPMVLPSMADFFNHMTASEIFDYAPSSGDLKLREKWKQKLLIRNSTLKTIHSISLPVIVSGITHGITVAADMFVDPGDEILIPDKIWENYNLIFEERYRAKLVRYSLFDEYLLKMDIDSLEQTIMASKKEKIILLFNFPNNPTGYTPTHDEMKKIVDVVRGCAEKGKKILVIADEAYFGLFYDKNVFDMSIIAPLVGLHPNVACVKIDGISKEDYSWGLRIGFVTFGDYYQDPRAYKILQQKATGCVRSSISTCCRVSQSVLLHVIENDSFLHEKKQRFKILKNRALKVQELAYQQKYTDCWDVYPFNSGYFMCIRPKGVKAVDVRRHTLEEYGIGLIFLENDIRIAFSSVDKKDLEELFDILAISIRELQTAV